MNYSTLQSMNHTMPNALGPTKVDHTGVQYNLVSSANANRYHILSESDLEKEAEEIRDARNVLMSLRENPNKSVTPHAIRTDKAGKNKRQQSAAFEEALQTKQYTATGVDGHLLKEILDKDAELEATAGLDPDAAVEIEYAKNATHPGSWSHLRPSGLGVPHTGKPEGRVEYGMKVIKERFHDNVDIIEKLFNEKEALKERVEQLENDLLDPDRASWILKAQEYGLPHSARHIPHHNHYSKSESKHNDEEEKENHSQPSRATAPTKASKGKQTRTKKGQDIFSPEAYAKKLSEPMSKNDSSKSVSKSLLADIDRYNQKRRNIEMDEEASKKLKEAERKAYDDKVKKTLETAKYIPRSGSIRNLEGVNKRSKEFIKNKQENIENLRKYYEEQYQSKCDEYSKSLSDHIKKGVVEQEMTYDAQLALEETQRKERIERRKNQLLFDSKAPVDYEPMKNAYEQPLPDTRFFAPDPKEVIDRLDLSTLKWNQHLETVKEKQRTKEKAERDYYGAGSSHDPTIAMERRQQLSRERRNARMQRTEETIQNKEKERVHTVRKEIQSRLNNPPPESGRRLTAAAEKRALLVRQKIDERKAKELEHFQKCAKKSKENEKMISNLRNKVSQEESHRKSIHGNFIEINSDAAAYKAEQTARESNLRSRENKQRIQDSLKSRVSLYDRHRHEIEKQAAVDRALGIVKDAVTGNATTGTSSYPSADKENNRYSYNDSKHYISSESKTGNNNYDDEGDDSKMLYTNPKKLAHETFIEILDGKEKTLVGLKDYSLREAI